MQGKTIPIQTATAHSPHSSEELLLYLPACPFVDFLSQQQKDQTCPFHPEMTDDRDMEQICAEAPPSPLTTRSVSQTFESPWAHPSKRPAKLVFSLLHPFVLCSLSLFIHSVHCNCKPITFTAAFFVFYLCH